MKLHPYGTLAYEGEDLATGLLHQALQYYSEEYSKWPDSPGDEKLYHEILQRGKRGKQKMVQRSMSKLPCPSPRLTISFLGRLQDIHWELSPAVVKPLPIWPMWVLCK